MGIVKTTNYVDVYRLKAQSKNIEVMSGRDRRSTDFINGNIIAELHLGQDETVLDVGCGDGTFLTSINDKIKKGTGVVPTEEELERLKMTHHFDNINFIQGLSSSLSVPDGSFSRVVCNSVLFILPNFEELEKTIAEISRVTTIGGLVYLGEVMIEDELADARREYGDSLIKWLFFVLKKRGIRAFFSSALMLLKCVLSAEPFIIAPKKLLVVSPDKFIELCLKYNLKLIKQTTHKLINDQGEYEVPSRLNFILARA